jgi:hypothetical protein
MASIIHRNARPLFWGGDAIYGESVTWVISDQLVFHSSFSTSNTYSSFSYLKADDFETVGGKKSSSSDATHASGIIRGTTRTCWVSRYWIET